MSIMVVGAAGQVGSALVRLSGTKWGFGSADLDLTSPRSIDTGTAQFAAAGGQMVINAAAYTAVDAAQSDEDTAMAVNATGPKNLAQACASHGLGLIHLSTDYVFSGEADEPYEPGDLTAPATVYGASKLRGEHAVLQHGATVVRTAWVYSGRGKNFVRTMLRLAALGNPISVVRDQLGSPTFADELARGLLQLASHATVAPTQTSTARILHATGAGQASWYEFARAVFAEAGSDVDLVHGCSSAEYPTPAPRPKYSVLSNESWRRTGIEPLDDWRRSLHRAFAAGVFD